MLFGAVGPAGIYSLPNKNILHAQTAVAFVAEFPLGENSDDLNNIITHFLK